MPAKRASALGRNSVASVGARASRGSRGSAGGSGVGVGAPPGATEDEEYSLSLETNEFLTRLASGLSDENEGLRALVGRTVEGLREMSGFEAPAPTAAQPTAKAEEGNSILEAGEAGNVTLLPAGQAMKSADELSAELDAVLEHLRTILTNPSFVPIEEVEVRDEEIARLRTGFGRLEARWRDAVLLIDGWRRRMGSGGRSVDVDELGSAGRLLSPVRMPEFRDAQAGRDFDGDAEAQLEMEPDIDMRPTRLSCVHEEEEEEEEEEEYVRVRNIKAETTTQPRRVAVDESKNTSRTRSPSPAESLHLVPAPGLEPARDEGDEADDANDDEDDVDSETSSIFEDDIDLDDLEAEEPNVQVLQESTWQQRTADTSSNSSPPLPEPPQLSPLKDSYSSGNRGLSPLQNRRGPGDFTTIVEENTWDLAADAAAANATAETAPAEDNADEPPVPPPHTVEYKKRTEQDSNGCDGDSKLSTGRRDGRPKASELLFSEESTMYDSPLFGRSGEKPSMSDPTRKLFASKPPKLTLASSPKKDKARPPPLGDLPKGDLPKSTPGSPIRSGSRSPTQASKLARSNPEPVPSSPKPSQSPTRNSPVLATATRTRSNSANSKSAANSARPNISATSTTTAATSNSGSSAGRNGNAATPPRNGSGNSNGNSTNNGSSRLPRRNNPPPSQPQQRTPLTMETIAAKLAAAEREADAARARAKLRAARLGKRGSGAANANSTNNSDAASKRQSANVSQPRPQPQSQPEQRQQEQQQQQKAKQSPVKPVLEDVDPVKKDRDIDMDRSPTAKPRRRVSNYNRKDHDDEVDELANSPERGQGQSEGQSPGPGELVVPKRKRDRERRTSAVKAASARRASRRRSTLSPWELESLIQGNVGVESPAR